MKKKQPKTIADLNINLVFMRESLTYDSFIEEFKTRNPKLPNFEIKPDDYLFNITINDKLILFRIYVMRNGGMFDNTLYDLMFQISEAISTYLFDTEIFSVFELKKFVNTTIKPEQFTIDCEIILL